MKHWHRCDRWTKQGFQGCPLSGIPEHEDIEEPEDLDDDTQDIPPVETGKPVKPVPPLPPLVEKRTGYG